jgi:hypothetical protein
MTGETGNTSHLLVLGSTIRHSDFTASANSQL